MNKEELAKLAIESLERIELIINSDLKSKGEKCSHDDAILSQEGMVQLCETFWNFLDDYRMAVFEMCQKKELCELVAPFIAREMAANYVGYACGVTELFRPDSFNITLSQINKAALEHRRKDSSNIAENKTLN